MPHAERLNPHNVPPNRNSSGRYVRTRGKTTDVKGIFSPMGANGAVPENRARIYAAMYQAAGEKWVKAGAVSPFTIMLVQGQLQRIDQRIFLFRELHIRVFPTGSAGNRLHGTPYDNAFRSTDVKGIFSPMGANGAVPENRARISQRRETASRGLPA